MHLSVTVLLRATQWCFLLLVVAGCANQHVSDPRLPLETLPPFSESGDFVSANRWWSAFADPQLDDQINVALKDNFTLAAACQRIRAARALARREASDFFPDVDGILDVGSNAGPGPERTTYITGLDVAYQVDLWGEIESRVDAQRLRADATREDYQVIALTLSADIARTWFSLIEAHAQVELLEEQIKSNRTGLDLQKKRFGLGLIRSPDVVRQQQLLESTLEQAVIADARIEVLEHQLAVLLGKLPQAASYQTGSRLPDLPPLPDAGLPSELVCRRPDVRRDYLALLSADRDLASAISSQYPRLNLTGSVLNIAQNSEALLSDWFVSIGSQLIAPLVDGGQRRAEVDRTCAVKRELFNEYVQTMLVAFREVEDGLAQEKYQLLRIKHLEEQVRLAGQSSDQLLEQYLIGDVEYLDVLSAITGQQRLQRQLLTAQLELVLIRVSLYLALAGGFDTCEDSLPYFQNVLQEDTQLNSPDSTETESLLNQDLDFSEENPDN